MERAAEEARAGNLAYISSLPAEDLARLLQRVDEDGRTLLHAACTSGSLNLVQFLLERGAASAVNQLDEEVSSHTLSDTASALSDASQQPAAAPPCRRQRPPARCPARPSQGWSPLLSAVSCGSDDIVKVLLSLGADLNRGNHQGRTPLHYAVGCLVPAVEARPGCACSREGESRS